MKTIRQIGLFIVLIMSSLSLFGQDQPEVTVKTSDGQIYVGQIVMENDEMIKMVIGKRSLVNIEKSKIISREEKAARERNHTISTEFTNYSLLFPNVLNYDYNIYRKDNLIVGGTLSAGFVASKVGGYVAFRQPWQDLLKAEIGVGLTTDLQESFAGPYIEGSYRSQRDNRWFFWEVSYGYILNVSSALKGNSYFGISLGVSF